MYTQNKATTASHTIFFQQNYFTVNKTPHTHEIVRVQAIYAKPYNNKAYSNTIVCGHQQITLNVEQKWTCFM